MDLDQEIRAGHEAHRVFNDPVFSKAFETIETGLIDALRKVPIGDHDGQHEIVLMIQLLGRLKGYFQETMTTGKMAQIQKETLAKSKRLVRTENA